MPDTPPLSPRFLVLSDEAATPDLLAGALSGHVEGEIASTAEADVHDVWARYGPFHVLIAGADWVHANGLSRLAELREAHPEVAVLVVTDGPPPADQVAALVRVGAVDLLHQPLSTLDLRAAALRALRLARPAADAGASREPVASGPRGQIVTVASATGGCGKTFVATNLAWFLARQGNQRVALVDLDLQFGEVSTVWHLSPRHTIADAVSEDLDADPEALADNLAELTVTHESGVSVLAAPDDPAEADRVTPHDVTAILEALRRRFDTVVVDTVTGLSDQALAAFDLSDQLYLVSALDLPSLRNTKVMLQTLRRLRVVDDRVVLILNKADEAAGIPLAQLERVFPHTFDAHVPYDGRVLRSFTDGRTILDAAPQSDAAIPLRRLFAAALPPDQRGDVGQDTIRPSWWRRLGSRTARHSFGEAAAF